MKPMRLIYIYHSGFIIESKEFAILIDYYRDTPEFYVHRHFLKRPGRLYILSSHAHPDHFNPEILSWKPERPDIRYILSEDIRDSQKACFHNASCSGRRHEKCTYLRHRAEKKCRCR